MSTTTNVILACSTDDTGLAYHALCVREGCTVSGPVGDPLNAAGLVVHRSGQEIRDALAKVEWSEPAVVRLLIQEQGDAAFSVWKLSRDPFRSEGPVYWRCALGPDND
jgi:hypothetical protein